MNALRVLLVDELRDLLDAEKQLTRALPKMARAASTPALRTAFEEHLRQTAGHVTRLEQALLALKAPTRGKPCPGMKGLISEGQEMMSEFSDAPVRDAALIVSAQKVEHYEIAAYGSCKAFATLLGEARVSELLDETLAEEKAADAKLSALAEGQVNPKAEASVAEPGGESSGIFAQAAQWVRGAVETGAQTVTTGVSAARKAVSASTGGTSASGGRKRAATKSTSTRKASGAAPRRRLSGARKK